MEIRNATAADFGTVFDFINRLEDEILDRERQHAVFSGNLSNPDIVYLLAFSGNEPVGFLSLHIQDLLHHGGPVGEIQEMFVPEGARGSGVGKKLIDEIKRIAAERGVLQLEVTSSFRREAAHRFYEREGFVHTHKKFTLK